MRVLALQLDGKVPNIAIMRIAAHHRAIGDDVTVRQMGNPSRLAGGLLYQEYDKVYASLIFEKTKVVAEQLAALRADTIFGGTGWDVSSSLERVGIHTIEQDYSDFPLWRQSIGFSQRGCRLKCGFCVVPRKEGRVREEKTIWQIWRGDPWPREVVLLDNDFFGQEHWRERIAEMRDGKFKVSFNQGINARMLTDETAEAIASVDYRADDMKVRRIYTAWDSASDERRLFAGLESLVRHGVKPDHIMVYMLIGYWPNETAAERDYRRRKLREFGARPYPMPYVRNQELVGFQRWCIGAYDKRFNWQEWEAADYRPEKLGRERAS